MIQRIESESGKQYRLVQLQEQQGMSAKDIVTKVVAGLKGKYGNPSYIGKRRVKLFPAGYPKDMKAPDTFEAIWEDVGEDVSSTEFMNTAMKIARGFLNGDIIKKKKYMMMIEKEYQFAVHANDTPLSGKTFSVTAETA